MAVKGAAASFAQEIQGGAFGDSLVEGSRSPKVSAFVKNKSEKKDKLRRFTKRAGTILSFTSALR